MFLLSYYLSEILGPNFFKEVSMRLRTIICFLLTFYLLLSPGVAKEKAKKVTFDAEAAWSYIRDLSADSMLGRKSGQLGGLLGAQYIASKFKEWGLEPAAAVGSYFQDFTIEHTNIEEGVFFEVQSPRARRDFYYGEDWRVQRFSGSGNFVADIVFAGYGIRAPEKGYDDFAGVNVKGKWVLLSTDTPRGFEEKFREEADINQRIKAAQELGAKGVLTFRQETQATGMMRAPRLSLKKEIYRPDFVILSVETRIVDFIFRDLKTDLRYNLQQIERTSKPSSFETAVKAFVALNVTYDEKRGTQNVLAKISGVDPVLKDECVIIGAHMDHLGIDPYGEVMNGANDNASGTAVVMEIARVMKLNGIKPKRTVIFALWAGEEQGLLGSKYYTENPTFPIEKTVAYINMDMVGHGSGKLNFSGVYYGPEVWDILKQKLPKEMIDTLNASRGGPGGSDHTYFLSKGVPGFFVMTEGYHFKYHQTGDTWDLIKPEMLKKSGDFVQAAVEVLAKESGNFFPPMRQETYHFKYQTLVNYETPAAMEFLKKHGDAKDSHVDLQFVILEEEEAQAGDTLRVGIVNKLFSLRDRIKETKGLSLFSSSSQLAADNRQGKTSVIVGLKGVNSLQDNPRWAEVLARQGVYFIVLEKPAFLFGEKGLSDEGKKILEGLESGGILLMVKGLEVGQAKMLLENARKPFVLMEKNLPEKEVLNLIQKKQGALGLTISRDEDPGAYFKKLDEAKKALGADNLMVVNELCLWGKAGQEQMMKVISEMLKAKYESLDMTPLFSGVLLRILTRVRGEEARPAMFMPPF